MNKPGQFLEHLSAHLWATAQMDTFRSASELLHENFGKPRGSAARTPRLAVVLVGRGVATNSYPLFRKLRREGVYFKQVK